MRLVLGSQVAAVAIGLDLFEVWKDRV